MVRTTVSRQTAGTTRSKGGETFSASRSYHARRNSTILRKDFQRDTYEEFAAEMKVFSCHSIDTTLEAARRRRRQLQSFQGLSLFVPSFLFHWFLARLSGSGSTHSGYRRRALRPHRSNPLRNILQCLRLVATSWSWKPRILSRLILRFVRGFSSISSPPDCIRSCSSSYRSGGKATCARRQRRCVGS